MNMTMTGDSYRRKIHPHKFTLWVAMASILMMFAGFTSAYIVKRSDTNWLEFKFPPVFWVSTGVILLSSLTVQLAVKSFKSRNMKQYRSLITVTAFLGILFVVLQLAGFYFLEQHGVKLIGANSNPSASFLAVITGMHMLHVLGGVVVLVVMFVRAYSKTQKSYNAVPIEIASTYWHFVDLIWIYLLVFFNLTNG